jgi:hypothetical protein
MSEQLRKLRDREADLVKDSAKRVRMQDRAGVHRDVHATFRPIKMAELDVASASAQLSPSGALEGAEGFGGGYPR